MTATDDKTLDRCEAALAEVRERYDISLSTVDGRWYVIGGGEVHSGPFDLPVECQAWIDREMVAAVLEARDADQG